MKSLLKIVFAIIIGIAAYSVTYLAMEYLTQDRSPEYIDNIAKKIGYAALGGALLYMLVLKDILADHTYQNK